MISKVLQTLPGTPKLAIGTSLIAMLAACDGGSSSPASSSAPASSSESSSSISSAISDSSSMAAESSSLAVSSSSAPVESSSSSVVSSSAIESSSSSVSSAASSTGNPVTGTTYTISADDLGTLSSLSLVGGDEVVVTAGSGESIAIRDVTFNAPVLIRAETIGSVTLEYASIKNARNVILQGFVFQGGDAWTYLTIEGSSDLKILRNVFDHKDYNEHNRVAIAVKNNAINSSDSIEIGYNEFRDINVQDNQAGGQHEASFIKASYFDEDGVQSIATNLHIHHNLFKNIDSYLVDGVPTGDPDREAVIFGDSDSQDIETNNIIEYNLFDNCDGEFEIISLKTSSNIIRNNTFRNSMGSVTIRFGTNSEVTGNYFYGVGDGTYVGDGDDNYGTGGVRVYGSGHTISNNYMENLTGTTYRRPIMIDSGDVTDSSNGNAHEVSTNITVSDNIIVDSVAGGIHIGGDNNSNYNRLPTGISVEDNIVIGTQGILFNDYANQGSLNTWSGNQAYASGSATATVGNFSTAEVDVLNSAPAYDKPTPLTSADVGPDAP